LRQIGVPLETGVKPLGHDVFKLRLECVNMADARRARRHALLRVFLELMQVKIVAAVVDRRSAVERCL
jgi:hypothetical protein